MLYYRQPTRDYSSFIKNVTSKKPIPVSSINLSRFNPRLMLIGSVGYIGYRYLLNGSNVVHCQHIESESKSDNHFDWNKLLSYLSPDLFSLIAAIAVSMLISNFHGYLIKDTVATFVYLNKFLV